MTYKKRWILFGISLILLIDILGVIALGSGASLGGDINIPLGNQTFPNETTSHQDNANSEEDNDVDDSVANNTLTNSSTNPANSSATPPSNSPANTTQSESSSSSASNSSSKNFNKFVKNFIDKISSSDSKEDKKDEIKIEQEIKGGDSNSNPNPAGYKGQDVKIILVINTLCLFFAFVTLRNYANGLKKKNNYYFLI